MSLRAIKKQQQTHNSFLTTRQSQFKKHNPPANQQKLLKKSKTITPSQNKINTNTEKNLVEQTKLLGRLVHSNPELKRNLTHEEIVERFSTQLPSVRRKSENDITTLIKQCKENSATGNLLSAKSEVCLQTITSHNYQKDGDDDAVDNENNRKMISGARSHKDLTQSTYGARTTTNIAVLQPRRLSESSLNSAYSQQTNSNMTSSTYSENAAASSICSNSTTTTTTTTNAHCVIGIRGYEVIEERARFTVYKLKVENPITNDCWLVLRRYTDFVRLNNKLKHAFPHINLMLPRKKIFGDNFNSVFLDNRVQGLQMFVNSVMAREELRRCKLVREFFCLDEPPSYSESMEECRAIFEAQEETISHLKTQISNKNELILNLQKKLRDELLEKEKLKEVVNALTTKVCSNCAKTQ